MTCIGDGPAVRACGFSAGPLAWVMAGALGPTFNAPAKAREHIAALFKAAGWRAVWADEVPAKAKRGRR